MTLQSGIDERSVVMVQRHAIGDAPGRGYGSVVPLSRHSDPRRSLRAEVLSGRVRSGKSM